jgi:hypothetical protein
MNVKNLSKNKSKKKNHYEEENDVELDAGRIAPLYGVRV